MTDENKTLTWQELEDFRKEEAKPEVPADGLLRTLVKVADESALSVGVTLSVGGILISGLLIGHKEFMELFAKHWINSTEDEEAQQSWREAWLPSAEPSEEEMPERTFRSHGYVHLKEARCFHSGGEPMPSYGETTEWLGRLAAIDGWNLGSLGVTPPS